MINWSKKKIGDISKINYGYTTKASFEKTDSYFLRITDIKDNKVDWETVPYCSVIESEYEKYKLINDDIVFARTGATTGKSYLVKNPPKSVAASYLIRLRLTDDNVLAEFIAKYFQTFEYWNKITLGISGSAQGGFNASKLSNLVVPVPPIEEQKQIVKILDEAFEGIAIAEANTKKNLANAIELFDNSVFSNFYNKSYKKYLVSDLVLSKKGAMRTGPFGSQLLHSEFVDRGIAVLGIDNAVNNQFQWGKRRFITEEKYNQLLRYTVKPGDVLITIMGTCGRCAVVPENIPVAINTKHLCCISLDRQKCLPEFLHAYFLYYPTAQKFLNDRAKGSIMAGLNMTIIKELPVFLPSIKEQTDLVKRCNGLLKNTKRLEKTYQSKLEALAELKQSILQKAFTGQLTN